MMKIIFLTLIACVAPATAVVTCGGDLTWTRCDTYQSTYGHKNQRTCQNQGGDSSSPLDCSTGIACVCADGYYRELAGSETCTNQCDTTPPTANCPAAIVEPAPSDSDRKEVYFVVTCDDDYTSDVQAQCTSQSGDIFSLGEATTVTCTCTDDVPLSSECSFTIKIVDNTDPTPTCPNDMTLTISDSANEVALEYSASCSDNSGESIQVSCSRPLSGDNLSLQDSGEEVSCTCTDSSGNDDDCSFTVTVEDNTDPTPTCPNDMTLTISDSANEVAFEYSASCSDNSGESILVSCSRPLSGDNLSLQDSGEEVSCTCTDSSGNADDCSFTVTVEDDTAPEISCEDPDTVFVVGPDFDDVSVSFITPICTDNSGNDDLTPSCDYDEDDVYSIGTYEFTCTCEDSSGNTASCTITAEVDGVPDLQCVDQTEAFTADDDPDNPLQLVSNLILPEEGEYEIQVIATPLGDTPGDDLSCTHTVTVN